MLKLACSAVIFWGALIGISQAKDCNNQCISIAETPTSITVVVTDVSGSVLFADSAFREAGKNTQSSLEIIDTADLTATLSEVLPVGGKDLSLPPDLIIKPGDEVIPLPGGGALVIIHRGGFAIVITINPDGTIKTVKILDKWTDPN